jgi:hypothetical protein
MFASLKDLWQYQARFSGLGRFVRLAEKIRTTNEATNSREGKYR